MGNTETHPVDGGPIDDGHHDNQDDYDPFDGIDTLGYRVLGVQPNSPASKAGLVSFLDFLVGANRKMLLGSGEDLQEGEEYDDVDLPALLETNKGQSVEFLVWNIKSQQTRLVDLTPNDDWGGAGLLGVTIRLDNYAGAEDRLIRVLTVEDQSPAAVAGLVPQKDFLLGTAHQTLENTHTLASILHHYEDRVVELYVYNSDSDLVRVVALMPTLSWGGQGLLGAEVGIGYLHRLPSTVRNTEGASVERKVRYVTTTTAGDKSGNKNSNNNPNGGTAAGGDGGGDAAVGTNTTTGATTTTILEMEPQLEMEPAPADDEHHEHEHNEADMSGDLSSVALSETEAAEQQQQQSMKEQGGDSSENRDLSEQEEEEKAISEAATAQNTTSSHAGETTTTTHKSAGDVFSTKPPGGVGGSAAEQQPQQEAPPAAAMNFLPPPPKMNYGAPPPPPPGGDV